MADLTDCPQNAITGGEVDPARARAVQEKYRDLVMRYTQGGNPDALARQLAANDVLDSVTATTQRRRHTVLAQVRDMADAQREFAGVALTNPDALLRRMDFTQAQQTALTRSLEAAAATPVVLHRTRVTGQLRDKAMVQDVARELHGQSTGNINAREFADAIRAVQEDARQMFNMLGGDIGKLEGWGLPHSHNAKAIRTAGFQSWFDTLWTGRMIDWHKITDFDTGKPFTASPGGIPNRAAAERFLRDVYEGIAEGGWARREPSMQMGGAALYNRRKEHRVLHFTDGDAWLRYNDAFGNANPFDTVVGHLRGLARDIALMQNFGPNPRPGLEFRAQIMAKDVAGDAGSVPASALPFARPLRDVVTQKSQKAQVMMRHLSGEANVPHDGVAAAFFAGTRNLLTAAQLGSAVISQVTDLATMRLAAKSIGLAPRGPWQSAMDLMTNSVTRQQAADLGFIFDTWFDAGSAQARMIGDVWSPEWTNRLTNFTMRSTGLSFLTDRSRTALRYTFALELGEQAGRSLNELDPALQRFLSDRGITASDWDALRAPGALYTLPTNSKDNNTEF